MPYKDGVWYEPEEWARLKAERKALNKAAFNAAKGIGKDIARKPIGSVVGNKQRMQEFKNSLLTEYNGNRVINKVLDVAMDDEHPGQMGALKLCMDRMLPSSLFETKKDSGRSAVTITINGIGDANVGEVIEGEVLDGEP